MVVWLPVTFLFPFIRAKLFLIGRMFELALQWTTKSPARVAIHKSRLRVDINDAILTFENI